MNYSYSYASAGWNATWLTSSPLPLKVYFKEEYVYPFCKTDPINTKKAKRSGLAFFFLSFNHCDTVVKQIARIVRSRRRFGMVLYGKCFFSFQTDTLVRIVIHVNVGYLHLVCLLDIFSDHPNAVVLGRNFATVGHNIFYRVVYSTVTIVHFLRAYTICQGEHLVPKTNAEHGLFC